MAPVVGAVVPSLVARKRWDRGLASNGKVGCYRQGARALSGLPKTWDPARPSSCLPLDPHPDPVPCRPPCRPVLS